MTTFETVIGVEVHVELHTATKLFCGCATSFGAPPNSHTCPVCLGHPGVLPVFNRQAVAYAIKAAQALHCTISPETHFDRKNYFYPDSPKAYQISQADQPIGRNGWLDIPHGNEVKRIRIDRVHLEEDAGKLTHHAHGSAVDFNRAGTPLIEIVTHPDLRSPEETKLFLEQLRDVIVYCGVSDGKMEEGSLRCDANISLRLVGATALGTKTELKNMNSFRGVQSGLLYEQQRQQAILCAGEKVIQETRRWDEAKGITIAMRSKEHAHDYRYFLDPDLVRVPLDASWINAIKATIPEMRPAKQHRYTTVFGLSAYDAQVLTATLPLATLFEQTVAHTADPKTTANWLMGDVLAYVHANGQSLTDISLTAQQLGQLIGCVTSGKISHTAGKTVLKLMMETGKDADELIEIHGLAQVQDEEAIRTWVKNVIASHPQSIEDVRQGKTKAISFLVGQVMKQSKGKASPTVVQALLQEQLEQ